jgi:uncharacterized membrane protein (DUF373 family)
MPSTPPMKPGWNKYITYSRFESIALGCIVAMIGAVAAVAIVWTAIKIVNDMLLGATFLDKAALQDTVGLILVILILLEFNHSVVVSMTERSGAVQVRMLVRITILVVTRKLMLMDFAAITPQTLLGFGGLLLALGGLYWLVCDGNRRQAAASGPAAAKE